MHDVDLHDGYPALRDEVLALRAEHVHGEEDSLDLEYLNVPRAKLLGYSLKYPMSLLCRFVQYLEKHKK